MNTDPSGNLPATLTAPGKAALNSEAFGARRSAIVGGTQAAAIGKLAIGEVRGGARVSEVKAAG
jgi:hypothetical protein